MESAGIRIKRKRSGFGRRTTHLGADRVGPTAGGADRSQTYCPCLEGLVLWALKPKLSTYL